MDYFQKYLKYKKKYLNQKGGTSDARIEDRDKINYKSYTCASCN